MSGSNVRIDRRVFIIGLAGLVGGCTDVRQVAGPVSASRQQSFNDPRYAEMADDDHIIPALDLSQVSPDLLRKSIPLHSQFPAGTIIVHIETRRLYLVENDGIAMRYSVGVGREEALNFRGSAAVGRKEKWPRWTPTRNMIERMPRYAAYAGGMAGGIGNPLGARALYLYRDGADTEFRIHGTNEPETIGSAVSSGCIRLFNHDIIDLYGRVKVGAPVEVFQRGAAGMA